MSHEIDDSSAASTISGIRYAKADGQILQLPMELIEEVGHHCESFRDLANLRATHSRLASFLDKSFFDRAHVHVVVDEQFLHEFELLANSPAAKKIKVIKLANLRLHESYVVRVRTTPLGPWDSMTGPLSCKIATRFMPFYVPSLGVQTGFAKLLTMFENLESISTYDLTLEGRRDIDKSAWATVDDHGIEAGESLIPERLSLHHHSNAVPVYLRRCGCPSDRLSRCFKRAGSWPAANVLILLSSRHPQQTFAQMRRVSLGSNGWPFEHNQHFPELAKFLMQCPQLEDLRLSFTVHSDPSWRTLRFDEFFSRLVNDPEGRKLTKLVGLSLVSDGQPTDFSVSNMIKLLQSNRGTLQRLHTNFQPYYNHSSRLKDYFSTLLLLPQLKYLDLTSFWWTWSPCSPLKIQRLISGILSMWNACHRRRRFSHAKLSDGGDPTLEPEVAARVREIQAACSDADWHDISGAVFSYGEAFRDFKPLEGHEYEEAFMGPPSDRMMGLAPYEIAIWADYDH